MQAVYECFRPTVSKSILIAEWIAYILLMAAWGRLTELRQLAVALWPLLLFYCLACVLVMWGQRASRVTSGRGLVLLAIIMIALDQMSKCVASALLSPDATLPLIKGWLHLTNVHNVGGSLLAPAWMKPVLVVVAALVLPLSVIVYRYYISSKRRSLWTDLAFLGIFTGYASWLCDMSLRGHIIDLIQIPGIVAADFKDLFLTLGGACVIIEVLDRPGLSLGWDGWRAEFESTRRLITDVSVFAAGELRSCCIIIREGFNSLFLCFQQLREKQALDRFDRLRARMSQLNAAYSDAEVEAELRATDGDQSATECKRL
ncbi:MAG: signal peptidase II [Chloroflexota bacterium]|nr:signal peptidase II [Chloroflexota bacterium]